MTLSKSMCLILSAFIAASPFSARAQNSLSTEATLQADFISPSASKDEKIRRLSRGISDLLHDRASQIQPTDQDRILTSLIQLRHVVASASLVGGGQSNHGSLLLNETTTKPVSRKTGGALVFYTLNESSKITNLQITPRPVDKNSSLAGVGGVVISELRLMDANNSQIGGGSMNVRIQANQSQSLQINTLGPVKYIQVKAEGMQQDFYLQATAYGTEMGDSPVIDPDPIDVQPWPQPGGHGQSSVRVTATCSTTTLSLNHVNMNTGETRAFSIPIQVAPRTTYCEYISTQLNQKFNQANQGQVKAFQFGVCNNKELRMVTFTNNGMLVEAPPTQTTNQINCLDQAAKINQFTAQFENPCQPGYVHTLPSGTVADLASYRIYSDNDNVYKYRKLISGSKFTLTSDNLISNQITQTKNNFTTTGVRLKFLGGENSKDAEEAVIYGSEVYYNAEQLFSTIEMAPLRECFRTP